MSCNNTLFFSFLIISSDDNGARKKKKINKNPLFKINRKLNDKFIFS